MSYKWLIDIPAHVKCPKAKLPVRCVCGMLLQNSSMRGHIKTASHARELARRDALTPYERYREDSKLNRNNNPFAFKKWRKRKCILSTESRGHASD